jgi:hypothetical protein
LIKKKEKLLGKKAQQRMIAVFIISFQPDSIGRGLLYLYLIPEVNIHYKQGPRDRDRDRMILGFTTTYAISAYHH